ncbi:hypothetical protein [Actinoallomurus iriomotensis]|uniref:Uncharacterized protein n=1 Tax=Actinoallomurus iriomotensis TaxID=478107 RepID=A0A9W6RJ49_9ACTN|nr:hypothetical protein [Actinoallomurus iriomotensis]GLY76484.1 hypothetical protein Airi01_047510 [Actinoallomurus iriomotensis]
MSTAYITRARWVMAAVWSACGLLLVGAPAGADPAYAGRSKVFGLVQAGPGPDRVLFAPARMVRHGGPETVRPASVGRYLPLTIAPGAVIRASAPIVDHGVTDYVRGVRLTPEQLDDDLRRLSRRSHPLLDRAHMFELWFDGQGRIVRMQHYFSP